MTREEAKKRAEMRVYVYMKRGDIEEACKERGIKARGRSNMEQKLIEALTEESIGAVSNTEQQPPRIE